MEAISTEQYSNANLYHNDTVNNEVDRGPFAGNPSGRKSASSSRPLGPELSYVDRLFGRHTHIMIIACLFIITLICFVVYFCVYRGTLTDAITTSFISLLSGFMGYFVTSLKR